LLNYWDNAITENGWKNAYIKWTKSLSDITAYPKKSEKIGMSLIHSVWLKRLWRRDYGTRFDTFFDSSDIFPLRKVDFEGFQISVPNNYDLVLSKEYGANYMSLPHRVGVLIHDKDRIFSEEY
jgi:phosphorylcholine metabolism protein LicD